MSGITRRRLLGAGAIGVGVAATAGAGYVLVDHRSDDTIASAGAGSPSTGVEPFYGDHQSGIATAQQDRLLFAAFDVTAASAADLLALLHDWTDAAANMTAGRDVGAPAASDAAPPTDTGEAMGLDPAHLTITFGFGPGLFTRDGAGRFGLAAKRPPALVDLPAFKRDELDAATSGGDLCVQACSNDPQVVYHAIRNLTRIGRGKVVLRWTQQGFGRTSSTTPDQVTPRNLMGFKDGTDNIKTGDELFTSSVWVPAADGPPWMVGGSYLVARRIRMHIEVWDRSSLVDQEQTIGRVKDTGAPLGATAEHDAIDLAANGSDGEPAIPTDAHVRLANQKDLGIHLLRRGYSFTDGTVPSTGQLDAGLFFLAYQRDPRAQFVPMQQRLAQSDALNEYIQHVGSALFAVPPGAPGPGHAVGEDLFD